MRRVRGEPGSLQQLGEFDKPAAFLTKQAQGQPLWNLAGAPNPAKSAAAKDRLLGVCFGIAAHRRGAVGVLTI